MARLSKEYKDKIIKLYYQNISKKEMLEKMKILQSSFYRITKEARSEKTSKTNESSNDNDDNNNEKSTDNEKSNDNDKIIHFELYDDNKTYNELKGYRYHTTKIMNNLFIK